MAQFDVVEMMLSPLHSTNKNDLKLLISADVQLSLCLKLTITVGKESSV